MENKEKIEVKKEADEPVWHPEGDVVCHKSIRTGTPIKCFKEQCMLWTQQENGSFTCLDRFSLLFDTLALDIQREDYFKLFKGKEIAEGDKTYV